MPEEYSLQCVRGPRTAAQPPSRRPLWAVPSTTVQCGSTDAAVAAAEAASEVAATPLASMQPLDRAALEAAVEVRVELAGGATSAGEGLVPGDGDYSHHTVAGPRLLDLDRLAAEAKLRRAVVLPTFDLAAEGLGKSDANNSNNGSFGG